MPIWLAQNFLQVLESSTECKLRSITVQGETDPALLLRSPSPSFSPKTSLVQPPSRLSASLTVSAPRRIAHSAQYVHSTGASDTSVFYTTYCVDFSSNGKLDIFLNILSQGRLFFEPDVVLKGKKELQC